MPEVDSDVDSSGGRRHERIFLKPKVQNNMSFDDTDYLQHNPRFDADRSQDPQDRRNSRPSILLGLLLSTFQMPVFSPTDAADSKSSGFVDDHK